jgi:hypothetical protein
MSKSARILVVALLLAAQSASAAAQQNETLSGDPASDMVIDVLLVRPLGVVGTVLGVALTVVALPFTLPSGSVESSARTLILAPADYTFKRPLGEFGDYGE